MENIIESNATCHIEVLKVQMSDYNCWNWINLSNSCEKWKWPLVSKSLNISASNWPKLKIKVSFEILRTSRFQKLPSFLNLMKIWGSYCQKTNWELFSWTPCSKQISRAAVLRRSRSRSRRHEISWYQSQETGVETIHNTIMLVNIL